ncbi:MULTISPECIES: DoxX family protein [Burkholderiaceae]|uniref:DoxX-like protein n=1 Tax=Caballeronia sordidicola TaxID=196367 RepID=A0A242MCX2_CABSO|nr:MULTISPECIES: hypothetical protein [Burkholderiaceae]OTP69030.1 hypothetical protein PAMC26510_27880 [Caballeronia sordidicola]
MGLSSIASPPMSVARRLALTFVFLWFAIGGVCHFLLMPSFVKIVPPFVPAPILAVIVSGVFELLGAAGITIRRTRRMAGIGLTLLTIAVTPANVFMLQHAELFPGVPVWALIARLPLQLALIACILWSTQRTN